MRTPASINHHPLHPMLVTFPIALWIFSLASDIIRFAGLGPPDLWREIAFYTMAGGIAGALLAAVPGLVDLLSIHDPRLRRLGVTHMLMNLFVVGLFGANWGIRLTGATDPVWPFIMSIIGVAVMGVAGWIGANLVHEYRVGVEELPPGTQPAS